MAPSYSLIVTCKGRLMHLKQTLPMFCQLPKTEVIVVDYSCPDGTGQWVEEHFPAARVVRIADGSAFNLPRARNAGAKRSNAPYLIFADADVKIQPGLIAELDAGLTPNTFATLHPRQPVNDLRGTCVVPRARFEELGGYDEVLQFYSMEDIELYNRLSEYGLDRFYFPPEFLEAIPHDDEMRVRFQSDKKVRKLGLTAVYYHQYIRVYRRARKLPQVPLEERQQIYAGCAMLIGQLIAARDPSNGARISMKLPHSIPEGLIGGDMEWSFEVVMTMKPKDTMTFRQKYQNPLLYEKF